MLHIFLLSRVLFTMGLPPPLPPPQQEEVRPTSLEGLQLLRVVDEEGERLWLTLLGVSPVPLFVEARLAAEPAAAPTIFAIFESAMTLASSAP